MKRWVLFSLLLLTSLISWGQSPPAGYVSVTATQIYGGGTGSAPTLLASGSMTWQAVDANDNPISYQANGVGQALTIPATCTITTGALVAPCFIADTGLTNPLHLCFDVTIRDANNNLVLGGPGKGYTCVQPINQGSQAYSFDTFNPTIASVPIVSVPVATTSTRGLLESPNCLAIGLEFLPQSTNFDGSWNCIYGGNTSDATFLDGNPSTADSGLMQHKYPYPITITRISCSAVGGTVSINLDARTEAATDAPGTSILAAPLVCPSGATAATTSFALSSIAQANSPIALNIISVSGATFVRVHLETKQ